MNKPLLRFLATQNYKNLSLTQSLDKEVELKKLNILIGSNGSGKSNFISCLKFLKDCLTTISDEGRGISSFIDAVTKMGRDRILDCSVESPAMVRLVYCFSDVSQTNDTTRNSTILDVHIYADRKERIFFLVREHLCDRDDDVYKSDPSRFSYYDFQGTKGNISVYDNVGQDSKTHFEPLDNIPFNTLGLVILPRLLENSKYPPESIPVYKIRRDLINFISEWRFYNANNMDSNQIRTSEPKIGGNEIYLSPSGDNLPLVLENLIQKDIDFEDSINQAMKSILPQTRRLRPIRSGRLSLTVEWYFEDSKEPFYLSDMSDGTVRMLCWATILHSPVLPSLLVIDEPDLGLHMSWMPILAEWIKKAATKTQVIITTHSPDLLDHFTDCLENVICFYSEDKTHFSKKTLSKEMLDEKLEEGWQLGDLYRVGDPIIGGWPW